MVSDTSSWCAGAGIALYAEEGAGESYQAHITSYDYDCMVSEAGQYGQPGIGGPNKYEVICCVTMLLILIMLNSLSSS